MQSFNNVEDFVLFTKILWPDAMFDGRCTCPRPLSSLKCVCAECRADQKRVSKQRKREIH